MTLMAGKRGLVLGVANDKSIAWGIARSLAAAGAEVALSHQGEALKKRVGPLGDEISAPFLVDMDVTDDASLDAAFARVAEEWDRLDFLVHAIAFAPKEELTGRFRDTTRDGFRMALDISAYSFIDTARRAAPLMTEGGAMLTVTYAGSYRVQPYYNVMGVAKAALESATRYLAADLGPDNIRVNAVSPGPMRTLSGAAIGGARKVYRQTEANAPLGNATLDSVGGTAVYLCSDHGAHTTGEIVHVDGGYHILGMGKEENL